MIFCTQTAHQIPTLKVAQKNFMNHMGTVQTLSTQSGEKRKNMSTNTTSSKRMHTQWFSYKQILSLLKVGCILGQKFYNGFILVPIQN
jgi:hypothetical protein